MRSAVRHLVLGLAFVLTLVQAAPAAGRPPQKRRAKTPEPEPIGWITTTVKPGDSLARVARRHKISVSALMELNGLRRRAMIHPGQKLRIGKRTPRSSADSRRRERLGIQDAGKPRTHARWVTYKVRKGDCLWRIADHFDVSIGALKKANGFGKRYRLVPGDVIRIKERGSHFLSGGEALPAEGKGYLRMRPTRSWGTPGTVRLIEDVYAEMTRLYPGTAPAMIGDLSKEDGGFLPPHKSHQRGVDVDVSYYKNGNVRTRGLEVMSAATLDVGKTWDVIRLFLNTGHVTAIFMDYDLQGVLYAHVAKLGYEEELLSRILQYPRPKDVRRGIIRHSRGHHHHLHVRFDCISSADPCRPSKTPLVPDPAPNLTRLLDSPRRHQFPPADPRVAGPTHLAAPLPPEDDTPGVPPFPPAVVEDEPAPRPEPARTAVLGAPTGLLLREWRRNYLASPLLEAPAAAAPRARNAEAEGRMTRFGAVP